MSLEKMIEAAGGQVVPQQLVLTPERARIFDAIIKERNYQNSIWQKPEAFENGDPDYHSEGQWANAICCYAENSGYAGERKPDRSFEERMVKAAALAVAAIEWYRKSH